MQSILIFGYGAEGISTEKFLQKHFWRTKIQIYDEKKSKFSALPQWKNYDTIFISPGIDRKKIPQNFGGKIYNQWEFFLDRCEERERKKIIGITGSKGKSTTTKFTEDLLKNAGFSVKIGGNYGVPILDLWDDFFEKNLDFLILEISSFQTEYAKKSPGIVIFTSFFPDHLDRHLTTKSYFFAKANAWRHQEKTDLFITPQATWEAIDRDWKKENRTNAKTIFSQPVPTNIFSRKSTLRATHMRENLGTVWALSKAIKMENVEKMWKKTAENFTSLEHRLEFFLESKKMYWYNDSLATSPTACGVAIDFCGADLGYLILGGTEADSAKESKNYSAENQKEWEKNLQAIKEKSPLAEIIVTKSPIQTTLKNAAEKTETKIIFVENFQNAIAVIRQNPKPEKIVMFSPGAKSFDAFKNAKERGECWKKWVSER